MIKHQYENFTAIAYVLYEIFWVKPDFTPEHFLNQTDLTLDELLRHGVNAALRE